jgi:lipoprotein-anchoring transpeptidase ErfK/SrfK
VPADPDGFAREQGVPVPEVPPCLPTVRACVELAADHAWLLDNGRVVRGPVTVTPGDAENPTPRGSFSVQWKAPTYTSREFLVQMPWSVFFADGGIAFHEGNPDTASAGCVKLDEEDARAFFTYLQVGDAVQIV